MTAGPDGFREQAPYVDGGVVQIMVTFKTRNPFSIKALSISGVTWKWQVLNQACYSARSMGLGRFW